MAYAVGEVVGAIATATLDHERQRDALGRALAKEPVAALPAFRGAKARAVALRARPGAEVFPAGHDVDELPGARRDPLGWDDPPRRLVRAVEGFPAPVIATVEGSVRGGATETVPARDLVVAAEGATVAVTPAELGVPCNAGGMPASLDAAGLRLAKEMAFAAPPADAARAERLGLVNRVVPAAGPEAAATGLAREVAANPPLGVAVTKEQLRILAGAHPMTPQGFERVQGLRRVVYDSADYREGIRAFKEKRRPVFRGE